MFEKTIRISTEGDNLADLFSMLQNISGEACAGWHVTGQDLAEKGLMWVIVRYELSFNRLLRADETIKILTWASPVRHRMSQRNYIAESQTGEIVFIASGIWAIADRKTRSMVDPEAYGVFLDTEVTGKEASRPTSPQKIPFEKSEPYLVTKADLDINGHMNNTRYFAAAQANAEEFSMHKLKTIRAVFMNETREGELITIHCGHSNGIWYFLGEKEASGCFQIGFECNER